jgi:hypothetical protein
MGAILPLRQFLADQADVRLVNQSSALQGMVGAFALQIPMRHVAQFGVNDRHQSIESLAVPVAPSHQQLGHLLWRVLVHSHAPCAMGVARNLSAKHIPFCVGCQSTEKKWLTQVVSVVFAFFGSTELKRTVRTAIAERNSFRKILGPL